MNKLKKDQEILGKLSQHLFASTFIHKKITNIGTPLIDSPWDKAWTRWFTTLSSDGLAGVGPHAIFSYIYSLNHCTLNTFYGKKVLKALEEQDETT